MTLTPVEVLGWAELIMQQLSPPGPYTLSATGLDTAGDSAPHHVHDAYSAVLDIDFTNEGPHTQEDDGGGFVIWLELADQLSGITFGDIHEHVPQAIARLAEQLQDSALEFSRGQASPPCPGHRHPAIPDVVNDTAVWRCPQSKKHYLSEIIPV